MPRTGNAGWLERLRLNKLRLDRTLLLRGLVSTRSQAQNYIKLGKVKVNGRIIDKPGFLVAESGSLELTQAERYVSRAALKLASVTLALKLNFRGKVVLDVGSSTGGFTDYALRAGAKKVIAVDVGTKQLHPSLRADKRVELHEKADIRNVRLKTREFRGRKSGPILKSAPEIILVDVSFVSLRMILPHIVTLCKSTTELVVLLKPQFEAGRQQINKGVVKNDTIRRRILKDFEAWAAGHGFLVTAKADSEVAGARGNRERFYLLKVLPRTL